MFLLLLVVMIGICAACPPWTVYNDETGQCDCGNDLRGIVHCNAETKSVSVLTCFCMTYNSKTNQTVVGHCMIMCKRKRNDATCKLYNRIETNDTKEINNDVCESTNKTGQLCGRCKEGYGIPVYSYTLNCVKCNATDFTHSLFKYIAVAFLPLTLFYFIVIAFKVSVTSGSMVAYVMICQVVAIPVTTKRVMMSDQSFGIKLIVAIFSLWNLDILRSVYTPFCIHPKMTAMDVLALDYLVGVYPLVLIVLTYFAVMLHDRHSLAVRIWKPAYRFFLMIRREWDIRGSLIKAFATFMILSYVKILDVSFDILTPVNLLTIEGKYLNQKYLYNDGEVPYFGKRHLPYAILAIVMLTIFNIFPVILLLLYPCKTFQRCLHTCRLHSQVLHTFMDAFQGCYRHSPKDCRYVAALYLIVRILQLGAFAALRSLVYLSIIGFFFIALSIMILFTEPYKRKVHNKIDGGLFLIYACASHILISSEYTYIFEPNEQDRRYTIPLGVVLFILVMYGCAMVINIFIPKKILLKIKDCFFHKKKKDGTGLEESLPYRLEHEQEHVSLLQNPK